MNPLTNMKNVLKLSENDLKSNSKTSWHDMYKGSAWIFVGGFPYELTEGDLLCIFSQYGEIVNINLIRDKSSGKSKGYCFICYEDQRSTILTIDNLNGIKILNRTIRVDHVSDYKMPKIDETVDEITLKLRMEGCAPKPQIPVENIKQEKKSKNNGFVDEDSHLSDKPLFGNLKKEPILKRHKIKKEKKSKKNKKEKKQKKDKKDKKSKKRRHKKNRSSSSSDTDSDSTDSNPPTVKHKQIEIHNKDFPSTSTDNNFNGKRYNRSRSRSHTSNSSAVRHNKSDRQNKVLPSTSIDNHFNLKRHNRSRSRSHASNSSTVRHNKSYRQNKVMSSTSTDNHFNRKRYSRSRSRSRDYDRQNGNGNRNRDYEHKRRRRTSRS